MTVMRIVMVVKIGMVTIIGMPVKRTPWIPVGRIITPIPRRVPANVTRAIDVSDYWPCSNLISSYRNRNRSSIIACIPNVPGVWSFHAICINWFNNVVSAIKRFITNKLNTNGFITVTFNSEHCNVLCFVSVKCGTQNDGVNITISIVHHHDVINQIVTIQVEVINP